MMAQLTLDTYMPHENKGFESPGCEVNVNPVIDNPNLKLSSYGWHIFILVILVFFHSFVPDFLSVPFGDKALRYLVRVIISHGITSFEKKR